MMLSVRLECLKGRRRRLWAVALCMVAVQSLWLMWAVRDMKTGALAQGYLACLYQYPIINAIVMPVLASVLVSRLCDMEHRGNAFKQLWTLQPPGRLFDAKLILCAMYLAPVTLLQLAAIWLIGRMNGFGGALPAADCAFFLLGQLSAGMLLALIAQVLTLRRQNQFVPLAAGLILGFLGLMSMFLSPFVMRLSPASYYGLLSTVRLEWDQAARQAAYFHQPFAWGDLALLWAAFAALYLWGRRGFVNKEV